MSSLREDVSRLGRVLGNVLREQEGEAFFEKVESVRALVREARGGGSDAALRALLDEADTELAENLARAFAWYFQLVNLAEEYERVRSLRGREGPRPQSLEDALVTLKERGLSADEALALVQSVELIPTFTAHPTEMRRRTVRAHLAEIARELPDLGEEALEHVTAHVEAMWNTPELRRLRPTVLDEVKGGLWYVASIGQALPRLARDLRRAFERVYDVRADVRLPLRFASWMGGDRDGNPFVTPEATRDALALHAARAEGLLTDVLRRAYTFVSQEEGGEARPRAEVQALHDGVAAGADVDVATRLEALAGELRTERQVRTADELLGPPLTLARVFGRHLVSLDIREHSALTGAAVAHLLNEAGVRDYESRSEDEKLAVLTEELRSRRPLWPAGQELPEDLHRAISPIREVAEAARRVGPLAFGRYVISMSESVSDVLEPLVLAREVGFRVLPVPLFETLADLRHAPDIVRSLLNSPLYRAHLGSDTQEIMLGYSDSNKDAGFLAANWALHEAQRRISDVCREAGVSWRFFHGRGTSIGRGGGPASRAISGQPGGTIGAGLRITEQGEALSDKYSHPLLAHRNLEQALHGLLLAAARPPEALPPAWTDALTRAADASVVAYRALVEHPDFLKFFEDVTPIHEIARLNIASRPVRRGGPPTLQNLRAIPWVMSWTQNRANLPGWYGLGDGLSAVEPALLREMYREWPFFRAVLDNAQMSLAKSDMLIFAEYLRLTDDASLGREIHAAYDRTVRLVEDVVEAPLLSNEPRLKLSIELRNPYVDPIHRLQVELLRRARAHGADEDMERALLLSIQGIAAGMRNTG
ncbi:phosphoenolpyruvate carboxylase [Deinococcus yavapaiensis]|uniref:Phosphoenolpyruvate carboxylase n=1 Tax=Deinococcus yavapaiensis KR-236 TaxID=694435 RepID=A0A318S7Q7_9DEIO|nr:phosphoenolpyruvate carboxylase [Deinococcus yavapaiensis]PYE54887.1 phosphoenolpyruvate carboxylase type 1 [Deinococcus yavapaiensis KR-236]